MPSPVVHFLHGIVTGSLLNLLTRGKFAAIHTVILAFNCFVGPDIGSGGEWFARQILDVLLPAVEGEVSSIRILFDELVDFVMMKMTHHPLFYVVIWAPLLGILWHKLTSRFGWTSPAVSARYYRLVKIEEGRKTEVEEEEEYENGMEERSAGVSYTGCVLLAAAGGLSHHFYDILFEDNGQEPFYRWILSTGWWPEDHDGVRAPNDVWAVLAVFLCLLGFLGVLIWSSRRNRDSLSRFKRMALGIFIITLVYGGYNVLRLYIIQPRSAAVGEEADFGVIVFMAIFALLPLMLCLIVARVVPIPFAGKETNNITAVV